MRAGRLKYASTDGANRSAIASFFARPSAMPKRPDSTSAAVGRRQSVSSRKNRSARTIGPESSCGKNAMYTA